MQEIQFDSWVRKIPWRKVRLSTPVFLGIPGGSDVKNLPAMQETRVCSLGWEVLLEEGMSTHNRILAWRILTDRGAWRATAHGVAESDMTERINTWNPEIENAN